MNNILESVDKKIWLTPNFELIGGITSVVQSGHAGGVTEITTTGGPTSPVTHINHYNS